MGGWRLHVVIFWASVSLGLSLSRWSSYVFLCLRHRQFVYCVLEGQHAQERGLVR